MSDPMVGASTAVFGVHLSVAVTETVTVQWETLNGTAIAGVDYEAANGAVVFAPGETEKQIEVVVYGADVGATSGKNFYIKLHPPSNAVLFTAFADCTITVVDEDGVPVTSLIVAQGKRGLKGDPGLSAYEQAVLMGYEGTVEDWMNEIADASQAAARAEAAADTATEQGDRATTEANRSKTEADRAKAAADSIHDGLPDSSITMQNGETLRNEWNNQFDKPNIFGQSGMKIIAGDNYDAHHGWGGMVQFASGKLVFIWRKAVGHAIVNNAEIWAKDSYDGGKTWRNDRVIVSSTQHDLRPDPMKLMGNNRGGFFVNRATTTGGEFYSPYFIFSDDEGVNWTINTVPTASPYTFQGTGGIMEFPASVGGHDTLGFMSFGFLSASGLDAFVTTNNGNTWTAVHEVAVASGEVVGVSEWAGARIGNQDKWIFATRSTIASGWNPKMIIWITNNPLNWGAWKDSGLNLGGNPPCVIYDDATQDVVILAPSRGGRTIANYAENTLLQARCKALDLYNNGGNLAALAQYSVVAQFPHWFTAYLAPVRVNKRWFATATCAEFGINGGGRAVEVLFGDFSPTATELTKVVNFLIKNQKKTEYLEVKQYDDVFFPIRLYATSSTQYLLLRQNRLEVRGIPEFEFNSDTHFTFNNKVVIGSGLPTAVTDLDARLYISVGGTNFPAARSYSSSSTAREHYTFHNLNGAVGSISTSGTTTTYNTTSDETLKDFIGEYAGLEAISLIKADPVRRYTWKGTNIEAIGWGAQTSYGLSNDLATPGGWVDKDGEPVEENAPDAHYIRWSMDLSRRTPHLWAAMSELIKQVEALQAEVQALKNP